MTNPQAVATATAEAVTTRVNPPSRGIGGQTIRKIILIVLGVIWLLPVYLVIANAAKTDDQYGVVSVWKPVGLGGLFDNMGRAWETGRLGSGLLSTAIYSIVAPGLAVLIGAMVGYAIIALKLPHGFAWFVAIFSSTIVPVQMILMPLFRGYVKFDVYGTRFGLVLVYTVLSIPFAAFVMRNFFSGIAREIFEASSVDGASPWRIFTRIYLPMSLSALTAVFILQATLIWNDFLIGQTLAQSEEVRPIMPLLVAMQSTYGGSTMQVVLAGGLLVSLPTVVLFLATQRTFSRGMALGQF